ncbi:hypothetical protein [Sphaerisporangium flaviroseum]|uniref:MFS transporter n=1 Tax=Sphaerisporangium flaviroseum TaxID=509199 RepID=UPI0031E86DF3
MSSLGATLVMLARDLRVPVESIAWLASAFGAGLLVAAAAGPRLLRHGPGPILRAGSLVLATGVALLALASSAALAVAGALLLGLGGAALVLATPALLDGPGIAARLTRVNAAASTAGVSAPLALGGLDSLGPSGRLVLLAAVPPLLLAATVTTSGTRRGRTPGLGTWRDRAPGTGAPPPGTNDAAPPPHDAPPPSPPTTTAVPQHDAVPPSPLATAAVPQRDTVPPSQHDAPPPSPLATAAAPQREAVPPPPLGGNPPQRRGSAGPSRGDVGRRWARVTLGVSVEFCFVVWAVARLQQTGVSAGEAAGLASTFAIGMALGRILAPRLLHRVPVIPLCVLTIAAGTLLVVATNAPLPVAAGLGLAGLGVAPLYPVTLAGLVAAPGLRAAHAASLGALASGTAILLAPTALAAIGQMVDLRLAFLITVPLLAALAAIRPGKAS